MSNLDMGIGTDQCFFSDEISPLGDKNKTRGLQILQQIQKKTCKFRHILRENCQKSSHLDTPFTEIASTKQDFEK